MTKDEALNKKAENARELGLDYEPAQQEFVSPGGGYVPAIPAQRQALAEQPVQQEPVAQYIGESSEGSLVQLYDDVKKGTNLYTSPPAQRTWVGLDNDDLVWIYSNSDNVGQAISNTEAKLKEKNT